MDLTVGMLEAEEALQLFLSNNFDEAEAKMAKHCGHSIYHALGHGCILFIRAMMSCERTEMDRAMEAVTDGCSLINQHRLKSSFAQELFSRLGGSQQKVYSNEEMHAELCHSELQLARALLSFFADESLASLIKGTFRIRSCYHSFKDMHSRLLIGNSKLATDNDNDGNNDALWHQFESGVRGGYGIFNLMLSAMPARLSMLLQMVGFSGEKKFGFAEVTKCAMMGGTLRSPFAAMALLGHQLVITYMIGAEAPDLALCAQLIEPLVKKYPNGAIILFLLARFRLVSGQLDEALQLYRRSIRAQHIYRQFHHICHWELMIGNALLMHWNRAAWHAKKLLDEKQMVKMYASERGIYAYFLAILIDADEKAKRRKEAVRILMRKVPAFRVKIAGKSLPMEKFCERRALKWLERDANADDKDTAASGGELFLPQFEFLYIWNGFSILEHCPSLIPPIIGQINAQWEGWQQQRQRHNSSDLHNLNWSEECQLGRFLRAVCQRTMGRLEEAEIGFEQVIQSECHLLGTSSAYLLPNACLELALTRLKIPNRMETMADEQTLLQKALTYRGYALETKLHFRVHGTMAKLSNTTGRT